MRVVRMLFCTPNAITQTRMSQPNTSTKQAGPICGMVLSIVATSAFLALSCGGCWMLFGRDEQLATFSIGRHPTLNIYAEPEFHYEPPGFIYFVRHADAPLASATRRCWALDVSPADGV